MDKRFIRAFRVGNGNCVLVGVGTQTFLFDMASRPTTDDDNGATAWDLVSPWLGTDPQGRKVLDVFFNSHGHTDHCGGFGKFKEECDAGRLKIGEIWHNGHDRLWQENRADLESQGAADYLALRDEIKRRESIAPAFGDVAAALYAGNTDANCFTVVSKPADFVFEVVNPTKEAIGKKEKLTNDHSIVLRLRFSGRDFLFAGDAESASWQNSILKNALWKTRVHSSVAFISHHGSFTFFGPDRDVVRDADPHPLNYPAMDAILPFNLIISACSRFRTLRDYTRGLPPHYSAYKWYKKWFVDNRSVASTVEHPDAWKYTADGDIYMEYNGSEWQFGTAPEPSSKGYLPTGRIPARAGQTYG